MLAGLVSEPTLGVPCDDASDTIPSVFDPPALAAVPTKRTLPVAPDALSTAPECSWP